jgi:aryl-alcohol dehydrogenase-like predicted oxidoreductase
VDSILVGPTTVEQLDQALDAVTLANSLGTEVRVRIDETHRSFLGTETFYAR